MEVLLVPEAAEDLTLLGCAPVGHSGEGGEEPGHLLLPVVEGGGGRHHEEGAPHSVALSHVGQKGQGLHMHIMINNGKLWIPIFLIYKRYGTELRESQALA